MKLACDALVHHAATWPHAMAIVDESGVEHSWAAIERGSAQVCRAIEGSTAPGASIAISLPSGASFWKCVLGVARAARRPVLLPCPLPGAVRAKVMLEISPALLIDQARAEEMLRTLPDAYPAGDMRTEAAPRHQIRKQGSGGP